MTRQWVYADTKPRLMDWIEVMYYSGATKQCWAWQVIKWEKVDCYRVPYLEK